MPTPIDGLDPVELTSFARLAQADFDAQSQSLARFLPYRGIDDIRYSYERGIDTLVDEATFRAFDAESSIGRRPGTAKVTGELIPVSRKIPLSEYDQLRRRANASDAVINGIFDDSARLARGIAARFERARGELLSTGAVTLDENGVQTTYDSGRDGSLTIGAVAPLWSDHANATPLSDLIGWKEQVRTLTDVDPNRLLISEAAMVHLQQCDEVRGAFMAVANAPDRVSRDIVVEAFRALAGVTLEVYTPPAGMTVAPIASNTVVLLLDSVPLGSTAFGTPLEALEPEYSGLGVQPGIVAGAWKEHDPVSAWTHAVAIGLPLLGIPDATLSAQVLA